MSHGGGQMRCGVSPCLHEDDMRASAARLHAARIFCGAPVAPSRQNFLLQLILNTIGAGVGFDENGLLRVNVPSADPA